MRTAGIVVAVVLGATAAAPAQDPVPEVRQVVTFDLQPGALGRVINLYEQSLLPVYQDLAPLLRFRAYREAESPESLDLVLLSSYRGMAGMDAANDLLGKPQPTGVNVGLLYGQIDQMALGHHDTFVEMIDRLGDPPSDEAGTDEQLTVFEYLRVAPGGHAFFEQLLETRARPYEKEHRLYVWSETGRVLVGDEWDYVRFHGLRSLAMWHDYVRRMRDADFQAALAPVILARKTVILRREPRLSVR